MKRSRCKLAVVLPVVALLSFTVGSTTAWPQQRLDTGLAAEQDSSSHIQSPATKVAQHKPKDIADEIRAKLDGIGPVSYSYRVPGGAESLHTLEQKLSPLSTLTGCKATYQSTETTVIDKRRTTTTSLLDVDFALLQPSKVTASEMPAPVEAPAECLSGACGSHWMVDIATSGSGIRCNPRSSTVVQFGSVTQEQNFGCHDDANETWVHEPLDAHQFNVWVPDEDAAKHIQRSYHDLIADCGGTDVREPH